VLPQVTVELPDLAAYDALVSAVHARSAMAQEGDEQSLTITPAGFFAAGRKGSEMLSLVRGLDVITIDQVHQSLMVKILVSIPPTHAAS
jgi:hypothetical protein